MSFWFLMFGGINLELGQKKMQKSTYSGGLSAPVASVGKS